ncbi:uncharacterized protein MYCGRDRAFT_95885 [Zymoseptoria tritici IPO323]|uniref:Uncharacterized protein n=1 Tax=Zymoseptoria tritici (strain CBS 115943 / IPO323) TaxID=336722 RepID=F9XJP6_ZYMTI|nr:uncharacterized protein MYCGRDRAFT_95885 [Zymoseptoria tritici IPO323]EGP84467.1 hypothetical protein MYCGRDRAFT_95885 [Zymoseptoria tritici IPO323]
MAMWPFKRRRRAVDSKEDKVKPMEPNQSAVERGTNDGTSKPSDALPSTPPAPVSAPRYVASEKEKKQKRRSLQQAQAPAKPWVDLEKRPNSENKENVPGPAPGYTSREDITALPSQRHLDRSPHLRPVDQERARIPYNFRPYATSQTSLQQDEALGSLHRPNTLHSERTNTLRSKRSKSEYGGPMRKSSSRRSKRREERVREEEIRQLASSPIPIPKRPGDGPLRRDSKKFRSTNLRDSTVSLPPEGSIHSSMSGAREQRGWEVGTLDIFNPRPAVRLSGTPQFSVARTAAPNGTGVMFTIESRNGKEKAPVSRGSTRNDRVIGDEADGLGSGDIRAIMEREAKRKQKRELERQEKLDRKLRNRVARDRADSEKRARDATSDKRAEEARVRAAELIQARRSPDPPTAIHPALRSDTVMADAEPVGLGIGDRPQASSQAKEATEKETEDPFSDAQEHLDSPALPHPPPTAGVQEPSESPFDDTVVQTATAVRLSQAYTPPLSPVYSRGAAPTSSAQLEDTARQPSTSYQSTSYYSIQSVSDLTKPPPIKHEPRRSSDTSKERRTGSTWATIFRRGSNFRKTGQNDVKSSSSEFSFSNTSRESMRNQPIPAHLIDPNARRPSSQPRTISGTPARTMSRFHEDLPGMPISPPVSRTQSPDVTVAAAAAATQRRSGRLTPQPIDIRTDTPTSQQRGPKVSSSLASIDSEGSWLASGSLKRASHQSVPSRTFSRPTTGKDFNSSFEELGIADGTGAHQDPDAEYLARNSRPPGSNPALIGATPDEEFEDEELAVASMVAEEPALTVRGSVRRRPTLVQRDERLKSREGLVTEYLTSSGTEVHPAQSGVMDSYDSHSHDDTPLTSDGEDEEGDEQYDNSTIVEVERARSVQYGSRHSRQFSAGSARLLDVKPEGGISRERTPTPTRAVFEPAEEEVTQPGAEKSEEV